MEAQPKHRRNSKREALILAGIDEMNKHGVTGFSVRRVAERCGVTSGAPAKHFGDRRGFLAAVIEYVNLQWREKQLRILEEYAGDTRAQIVWISVNYVRFLVENPQFRSILTLKDDEFDNVYHKLRGELSSISQQLVHKSCEETGMDDATRQRKQYVIRSLIFGAALLFDNGEIAYNEDTMEMVRLHIDREFDLP